AFALPAPLMTCYVSDGLTVWSSATSGRYRQSAQSRESIMATRHLALRALLFVAPLFLVTAQPNTGHAQTQGSYVPDATWQHKAPAELGVDPALLKEAVDFAIASETRNPRDLVLNHYQTF